MTLDELNQLDFKAMPDWPMATKLVAMGVIAVLVVTAGWWFLWRDQLATLELAKQREQDLRGVFTEKKIQAINLEAYRQQLAGIKEAFGALLKQLPNKQEMDALITDINQAGLGRGLQFDLFRPGAESKTEFYAELPISVKVTGGYHDLASFASDVAKLSRIVTIQNISMEPAKEGVLTMDAVVKTYRYLDDSEVAAQKGQGKP